MEAIAILVIIYLLLVTTTAAIVFVAKYKRRKQHKKRLIVKEEDEFTALQERALGTDKAQESIEYDQLTETQEESIVSRGLQPDVVPQTQIKTVVKEKVESTVIQGTEQFEREFQTHKLMEEPQGIGEETKQAETKQAVPIISEKTNLEVEEKNRERQEESQPIEQKRISTRAKRRRRKPVKREERSREFVPRYTDTSTGKMAHRSPRPEVVCWEREQRWFVGVEIPDEMLLKEEKWGVLQNGLLLSQDDFKENRWLLMSVSGEIIVQSNYENTLQKIDLSSDSYLLFKLSGERLDRGRMVRKLTYGSYLLVVPKDWELAESEEDFSSLEPEDVAIQGYRAYFLGIEKKTKLDIELNTPEGGQVLIPLERSRFELVGKRLGDENEYITSLFSEPPRIRALGRSGWKGIKRIVVGEEGQRRHKDRTQNVTAEFSPKLDKDTQDLPPEILNRKGGWYYIRLYDKNDNLVDTLEFSFLAGLHQIEKAELFPFPPRDGHQPVCLRFLHDLHVEVHPPSSDIKVEREIGRTTFTIPPDPQYDLSLWVARYEGVLEVPGVIVPIILERIWWGLGTETSEPSQWTDRPLILTRDDIKAASNKAIWLRFPKRRWINKVHVGFEKGSARFYSVKVKEVTVKIPLRDFGDRAETSCIGKFPLKCWIVRGPSTYEAVLGEIEIKAKCKKCDFKSSSEEEIIRHIKSECWKSYFRHLSYEEMSEIDSKLPKKIYKCSHCGTYVATDGPENPTSAILRHLKEIHPNASKSFCVVDDIDEIRKNFIFNLPLMCRCRICGLKMKQSDQQMKRHLFEEHGNDLYDLC